MPKLNYLLSGTPYLSYPYTYPHKTAYRPFDPPLPLRDLWATERRDALFLYLHIPFCERRCAYCNLFTLAQPGDDLRAAYLTAVERQIDRVADAIGPATFARCALGGGTPTLLTPGELARLFDHLARRWNLDPAAIPVIVETSPRTATPDRLALLRERGVDRVSIGVQSFIPAEAAAAGRAQTPDEVEAALAAIRAAGFPILNLDLIYGLPGQTAASWRASIAAALRYAPEELYLYPLYARPLTGFEGQSAPDDTRLAQYRAGRELLLEAGYMQLSMRMFRAHHAPAIAGPPYSCQEDGMVGLGCGARSYTRDCHYASAYAVSRGSVLTILRDFVERPEASFALAYDGFWLDAEEQHRRYVLKSLFRRPGLDLAAFRARFDVDAFAALPELAELPERGLAEIAEGCLRLTPAGLELTDVLGPWLYSTRVQQLMAEYELH